MSEKKKKISKETIDYVAKLALLELSEEEKEKLAKQLNEIISYFNKLNDLNTSTVEPTTHPIDDLKNVFREDIPWKGLTNEEALKNAQYKKDGYIKAPKILKE
ncbi:MAG: Asp-tRNA(Asn)/Glu-tRNA(Gln) amidotransferase subunit GatC [Promethearchaeota archaeon]|nr:MAG: Asp-tRNA(Asn)/Glu-tRNA(Gln) amidotransferase subunit GatC [Candidatus Lokiarchaeota archaeon]